ncbi:Eco57I restriction-modification methylase domain-containing protein [Parafrankia discariae]|uniref:Eco57I restriction-modification methylase domain-containing protein n=1 Tax=Parafrankia discariae TaxID=365528 RepID=UPI0003641FE0|nr:hypothetical protein [Parafrankia discariae]
MLADAVERFLEDADAEEREWAAPAGAPRELVTKRFLFGNGDAALEVAVAVSPAGPPRIPDLRLLWKLRQGSRASPVLLVALYDEGTATKAATCGIVENPLMSLDPGQLDRVCATALREPNRHDGQRKLERLLAAISNGQGISGLDNRGLFAEHQLRNGVPAGKAWAEAGQAARPLLGLRGMTLIRALGYGTTERGSTATLLTHQGTSRAIAVLLEAGETFDRPSLRFGAVSPVSHAISVAARENLPWVIVLRGSQIRLHPVNPTIGVGRKSQGETFTELDLDVLSAEHAAFLYLLFSPTALAPEGSVIEILRDSANFAADLGSRLRERVYTEVVPGLAVAIARQMRATSEADLQEAYHRTLMVLFRLLFVAYAEDRALLPYSRNRSYDRHALKTFARMFADEPKLVFDREATSLWDDMQAVWKAVDSGNTGWDVPAYNGGLFTHDPRTSPSGAALRRTQLTDAEFGPVLRALLVDAGPDGTQGPVDFRSLSVREFGTLYEGLLESSLSIASSPLTINSEGSYVPAGERDLIKVKVGEVYSHNRSGKRKATGSYFTKSFAVEHLLDTALEPAIKEHLHRVRTLLDVGDDAAAGESFFDFRVADLAMGSGHFLIAAIDRIETRFTAFLGERPIAAVGDELARLAQAARDALGTSGEGVEVETSSLLRRQIARRCIYGLDLNLMAVELARLAVWIHTFVPGLPMSSLDHGLIVGNSLTGIGTIDEVVTTLDPSAEGVGVRSFYEDAIRETLGEASKQLARVARTLEATKKEVQEAALAYTAALEAAADAQALFDTMIAVRLGIGVSLVTPEQAIEMGHTDQVRDAVARLGVAHFPLRFPEVFLRERPGFDVLIGNPPWEKVKVEQDQWWGLRFPGLASMPQKQRDAAIAKYRRERPDLRAEYETEVTAVQDLKDLLAKGPFPGLRAATDTELSLAFAWRFWQVLRPGGRVGVVLPRTILGGKGGTKFRHTVLENGAFATVTMLVNSRRWVFDEVHPQYTIGLTTLVKGRAHPRTVELRGPFFSLTEFDGAAHRTGHVIEAGAFASWSEDAAFPVLPTPASLDVFLTLRSHPRLDTPGDWHFVPLRELHSTGNKELFDFDLDHPRGDMPVLTVRSFHLWDPYFGLPYAYAKSTDVYAYLQPRRRKQVRKSDSAMFGMPTAWAADPETLPAKHPRIVFRDTARAVDSRTAIVALVPGGTTTVHSAPYLLRRAGTAADEAYLLGVLSSRILDWYSRRYVELHFTAGIMSSLPIPRPAADDPLRRRAVEIAGRLAAVDHRYAAWAREVGVLVGSVRTASEKADLIAELDAVVALLYGLGRAAVEHIFETFHRGWGHVDALAATLHHFDSWAERKAT